MSSVTDNNPHPQDGTLSLIHIPLDLYPSLLQAILQVLLPPSQDPSHSAVTTVLTVEDHSHGFLNISVTPIECSIVCNSVWATSVFEPAIKRLPADQAATVAISKDTYTALSVYGTGMDAGSRVADLTSPLALAGIPIFFITTYCECVWLSCRRSFPMGLGSPLLSFRVNVSLVPALEPPK